MRNEKTVVAMRIAQTNYEWLEKQAKENGVSVPRYCATMVEEIVRRYKQYEKDMEEWLNA